MKDNIIYGLNSIFETISDSQAVKRIEKLYIKDRLQEKELGKVFEIAKANRIPIMTITNPGKFDELAGGRVNHQGIMAIIRDFDYVELEDLIATDNQDDTASKLIIVMDEIEDTHNVGAIIRSAVAVGATGIIVPKHRQAAINGTVYKTSAGTVNKIKISRVSNIQASIEKLKKYGYWIASLDMQGENLYNSDLKGNMAIIIGNEGKGVSKILLENSDYRVFIPMNNQVESLNASVSAALAMYEWKRQNS